jgi:hypothetical protein
MYLVSSPDLAIEACKAGIIDCFNRLNARTAVIARNGSNRLKLHCSCTRCADSKIAPYALNIIVIASEWFESALAFAEMFFVPIVITSLSGLIHVAKCVQAYGGIVFHIAAVRHPEKAIAAPTLIGLSRWRRRRRTCRAPTHSPSFASFVDSGNCTVIFAGGFSDGHGGPRRRGARSGFCQYGKRTLPRSKNLQLPPPISYYWAISRWPTPSSRTRHRGLPATLCVARQE